MAANQVADDPQQPWPHGSRCIEAAERAKEPHHGVLSHVESIVGMAGELESENVGLLATAPRELVERSLLALLGKDNGRCLAWGRDGDWRRGGPLLGHGNAHVL
jgi:hypothetical protein